MTSYGLRVSGWSSRFETQLAYILAHSSREAAEASWAAFRNQPERARVFAESEINGKLIANVGESVWADPTDYSPLE